MMKDKPTVVDINNLGEGCTCVCTPRVNPLINTIVATTPDTKVAVNDEIIRLLRRRDIERPQTP